MPSPATIAQLREHARPIDDLEGGLDAVVERAAGKRMVLLGEASHGSHEFYEIRAAITRRLISELGFDAVAVEADWPDAYRVCRWVRWESDETSAPDALAGFRRFPSWMWRNLEVVAFIEWLRERNRGRERESMAGFYGIDLYSLGASIAAVIAYLDQVDPDAARRARGRYACFDHFRSDTAQYGYAATYGLAEPCEEDVVRQLVELQGRAAEYAHRDGAVAADEYFHAEQNARLVRNAEEYYRSMFRGRDQSWNLRDTHMAETLEELAEHLSRPGTPARLVVWAHNSHLGDARATQMGERGELNVGQLVRERYGDDALLVGFTTYDGTVTAATDWDDPPLLKRVRPGMNGSYEALLHAVAVPRFVLDTHDEALRPILRERRLERAIGVIYRPETERLSHYFDACLAEQFDMVIHVDRTRGLEPLDHAPSWHDAEVPETWPSGL